MEPQSFKVDYVAPGTSGQGKRGTLTIDGRSLSYQSAGVLSGGDGSSARMENIARVSQGGSWIYVTYRQGENIMKAGFKSVAFVSQNKQLHAALEVLVDSPLTGEEATSLERAVVERKKAEHEEAKRPGAWITKMAVGLGVKAG